MSYRCLLATFFLSAGGFLHAQSIISTTPDKSDIGHPDDGWAASKAYGKLPLSFETNQGQSDAQVKFLSRATACF